MLEIEQVSPKKAGTSKRIGGIVAAVMWCEPKANPTIAQGVDDEQINESISVEQEL